MVTNMVPWQCSKIAFWTSRAASMVHASTCTHYLCERHCSTPPGKDCLGRHAAHNAVLELGATSQQALGTFLFFCLLRSETKSYGLLQGRNLATLSHQKKGSASLQARWSEPVETESGISCRSVLYRVGNQLQLRCSPRDRARWVRRACMLTDHGLIALLHCSWTDVRL